MDVLFSTSSILSILLISFDRSLACFSPFAHYKYSHGVLNSKQTLITDMSKFTLWVLDNPSLWDTKPGINWVMKTNVFSSSF